MVVLESELHQRANAFVPSIRGDGNVPVLPSPRTVLFDDSPRAKPEFALLDLDLALLAHGVCTAGAFVGRDLWRSDDKLASFQYIWTGTAQ
jgi:hypothetical protein